jgi:hypothetical protein
MNKIIFFLLLSFVFSSSFAQKNPEGKFCNTQEGRIQYIQDLSISHHDWILRKVERIPPDTQKYLSDEYRDAINTRNESRFQKIFTNPYYFAWRLRNSIEKFQDEAKNGFLKEQGYGVIKKNSHEAEILFYTNLLDRNFDVMENYDAYNKFDSKRAKPYFDTSDSYTRGFSNGMFKIAIDKLVTCSFKR